VGKEPEVADPHETPRQHVEKKAAQEFVHRKAHDPLLILVGGVAPAEGDEAVGERD